MTEEPKQEKKVPCTVYSRVVGFISPVMINGRRHWNEGKFAEWKDRRTYDTGKALTRVEPEPTQA